MRRYLAALAAAGFLVGLVPAAAPAAGGCTIRGTKGVDAKVGTNHRDIICVKAGADYVHAEGGKDLVRGSGQRDTLVGGYGADHVLGGRGGDRIFVVDGKGGDIVRGGGGKDRCFGDRGDRLHCEHHFGETHSYPFATVNALSNALGGSIALAEREQAKLRKAHHDLGVLCAAFVIKPPKVKRICARLDPWG